MNIDTLGIKVMEQLVERELVERPSDLYTLEEFQLLQLDGFKTKSAQKLLASIEKSKDIPLDRFLMALGMKFVGAGVAELLAKRAGSLENLKKLEFDELMAIDGVGDKVAVRGVESLVDGQAVQPTT